MKNSKLVMATLKATLSILLIGGIGLWSSSTSAKMPDSENTAQSLAGIVARRVDGSDGGGKRVIDSELEPTIKLPSEQTTEKSPLSYSGSIERITDDSRSDWEVEAANDNWLNLNHGEGVKNLVRLVIWRF
ncbi:hypothetical protein IQ255_28330 [Pleurocapsales cyanobacterium LEGE 10410]|nr:hypothetical protein [Pleurocapsales cyanobacterium LEGE 10410]